MNTENRHPLEGVVAPFLGESEMAMQEIFETERFPNVIVTLDGERTGDGDLPSWLCD